ALSLEPRLGIGWQLSWDGPRDLDASLLPNPRSLGGEVLEHPVPYHSITRRTGAHQVAQGVLPSPLPGLHMVGLDTLGAAILADAAVSLQDLQAQRPPLL